MARDTQTSVDTAGTNRVLDPTESGVIHTLEYDVRRVLLSEPELAFHSLVVRRVPGGVCLEGTLESNGGVDVPTLVKDRTGVTVTTNRLMVRGSRNLPPKG